MNEYGRRIVIASGFEAVVGEVSRALREEGLQTIARIDVRDHFWRDPGHDFRRYFLIEAWSPALALEALQHDLDAGTVFPTTFAIYELADSRTVVVVRQPFSPLIADREWRQQAPAVAAVADRETERVARVLARLQATPSHHASDQPAV